MPVLHSKAWPKSTTSPAIRSGQTHAFDRIDKYDAGEFDDEVEAADTLHEYQARIAALERLVGKQALEIEFLKGAAISRRSPRSAPTSAITGSNASLSAEDAS